MSYLEKRKQPRLPFRERVIVTDGTSSQTCFLGNISRGGVFAKSVDIFPLDTPVMVYFFLPKDPVVFASEGKIVHVLYDRQNGDTDCGMGIHFKLSDSLRERLWAHVDEQITTYLELKTLLDRKDLPVKEIRERAKRLSELDSLELTELKYRVHRVFTILNQPDLTLAEENVTPTAA